MKSFFTILLSCCSIFLIAQPEDSSQIQNQEIIEQSIQFTTINELIPVFNVGNFTHPYQLLQGRFAGLLISKPGGNPLEAPQVELRGFNSLSLLNQPLIVVNGIPDYDWTNIDLNDIESIEIIRDAATAARYGTRANDGVLLITTKTSKSKTPKIQYNTFFSRENAANIPNVLSADEYRQRLLNSAGVDRESSTNWFDEITRPANSHVHNLAFSGGGKQSLYRVSLNYRGIQGIARNNNLNQLSGNMSFQQTAFDEKLKFGINYNMMRKKYNRVDSDIFKYALIYNPTAPVLNEANTQFGGYEENFIFDYYNPVSIVEQHVDEGLLRSNNLHANASFEILNNLTLNGNYAFQSLDESRGFHTPSTSFYVGYNRNGLGIRNWQGIENQFFGADLEYSKKIKDHFINATLGYNFQRQVSESFFVEAGDFVSDEFTFNNIGLSQDLANGTANVGSYKSAYRIISLFGQFDYHYKNTVSATLNYRRDGSSRFGANNRWGDFYGISAGINFDKFISNEAISKLKLRAGYGVTGGLPSSDYGALSVFVPSSVIFYNGNYTQGFSPITNSNPDLGWESNTEFNIGLDIGVFEDLLNLSVDYFSSNATLINALRVDSPPNAAQTTIQNIGKIQSNGVEVSFNFNVIRKDDFWWTIGGNLTSINNILRESFGYEGRIGFFSGPGISSQTSNYIAVDEAIGQIWGLKFVEIANGNWVFEDLNGDGFFDEFNDGQVLGNGLPDAYFGIINNIIYKSFDINFLFRGVAGHDIGNENRIFHENAVTFNEYNVLASSFESPNNQRTQPTSWSDYFMEDGTFLRLEYLNVGYTILNDQFKARLYVNANNLLTLTGYSGSDPEVRFAYNENPLLIGKDERGLYLPTRGFMFGVQLTL